MQNERYYHPLSVLLEIGYITGFVLNCLRYVLFCFLWLAYNIPYFTTSEYSTTNTSNSHVDKYYVTKKSMVFLTLAPLNKSVKFEFKAKHIFLLFF
jgi:hypothetical protein